MGSYVACQVFGEGPRQLVFVPSFLTNLDVMWRSRPSRGTSTGWPRSRA